MEATASGGIASRQKKNITPKKDLWFNEVQFGEILGHTKGMSEGLCDNSVTAILLSKVRDN